MTTHGIWRAGAGRCCVYYICLFFSVFKCIAGSLSFNASAVLGIDLRLEL